MLNSFAQPSAWIAGDVMIQFLSLEDPPQEGIAYQARGRAHIDWDESSSAGAGNRDFAATTHLYSAERELIQAVRSPSDPQDHFGFSLTQSASRNYEWNGEVW